MLVELLEVFVDAVVFVDAFVEISLAVGIDRLGRRTRSK
jgi:hypothetical protein